MLTKKQKKFADEYLETGNGTRAALKAYDTMSENTAGMIASENIRKPKIAEYLESKAERAAERIFELLNQEENLNVALGAGKDILDRAGFKPVDKQQTENTVKIIEASKEGIEKYGLNSTPSTS
jgi:phage terminase small subunit